MIDQDTWRREACRYSLHIWGYDGLLDDHPEATAAAYAANQNPYDFVEELGEKYDLDRVDIGWGANAGEKFVKLELV